MKRANGAVSNQRQLAAMLLSLLLPRHHTSLLATSPVSGPAAACCSDTEICSRKNKYLQVQTDNVQYRYLDQYCINKSQPNFQSTASLPAATLQYLLLFLHQTK